MFIVSGMTPATTTTNASPEILATFERNSDAHKLIKMFNPLTQDQKNLLKGHDLLVENVQEKDEEIVKSVKIKNKYTVLYVEEV